MPTLKHLTCTVDRDNTATPFKEHGTEYRDGEVECFIAIPEHPVSFTIRLASKCYISPGLAMFVYMDGVYQCNRNRVNLKMPTNDSSPNQSLVDFRVRQKEESKGVGGYIGRSWRFENLNIVTSETAYEGPKEHFEGLGNIEILVLRCRPDDDSPDVGSSNSTILPKNSVSLHSSVALMNSRITDVFAVDGAREKFPPGRFGLDGSNQQPSDWSFNGSGSNQGAFEAGSGQGSFGSQPWNHWGAQGSSFSALQSSAGSHGQPSVPPGLRPNAGGGETSGFGWNGPDVGSQNGGPARRPVWRAGVASAAGSWTPMSASGSHHGGYNNDEANGNTNFGRDNHGHHGPQCGVSDAQHSGNHPDHAPSWGYGSRFGGGGSAGGYDQNASYGNSHGGDWQELNHGQGGANSWGELQNNQGGGANGDAWQARPGSQEGGSTWARDIGNQTGSHEDIAWGGNSSENKGESGAWGDPSRANTQDFGSGNDASGPNDWSNNGGPQKAGSPSGSVNNNWTQPSGLSRASSTGASPRSFNGSMNSRSSSMFKWHTPASRASVSDEPLLYTVPEQIAQEMAARHQVQPGPSSPYVHRIKRPNYLDSFVQPYARFIFKYRSQEVIEQNLGITIERDRNEEKAMLNSMSKDEIIDILMTSQDAHHSRDPPPELGSY